MIYKVTFDFSSPLTSGTNRNLSMATRVRYHRRPNVQTRLKENMIIMAVIIFISLWVLLIAG
jgi:hypothetical protein